MLRKPHPLSKKIWASLGLTLIFLWGCESPTALQRDYGRSFSHNTAEQMIYPPGAFDTPPVGMAPKTTETLYESYNKSFKGKEKQERPAPLIIQRQLTD
ncbi:MAG: hypothetical protein AB1491_05700 [Thermodesulfobacteriota bacterium]